MSLVVEVTHAFNFSDNASFTCVVQETIVTFYFIIVAFVDKFSLSDALIMAAAR